MVSYYRFYEGWLFAPGTVTISEYLAGHLNRNLGKDYWTHMESWWHQRDADNVLLLSFEVMQEDLRAVVSKVANFLGFGGGSDLIDLVTHQSSLEFMLEHEHRFNDLLHRERSTTVGALPPGSGSTKVTDGTFDPKRYELSPDILTTMEANWRDTMGANCGIHSYEALTDELRG